MKRFRVHEFVFDCRTYELTRMRQPVSLPRLPTRLLMLLLESNGQLLTQQTIVSQLWPHADLADALPNLHVAIKRVRTAFGDSAADPTYIQTVIGVGYRFIAPVEVEIIDRPPSSQTEAGELVGASGLTSSKEPEARPEYLAPAGFLASATSALPTAQAGPQSDTRLATSEPGPSTAFAGRASRRLWLTAVLLVTVSLIWGVRVWRGRSVSGALVLSPPVRLTANNTDASVTAQAISPDGRELAFADADGLMVQGLRDPAPTPIPLRALQSITYISWFPDKKRLLVSGLSRENETPQVWVATVDGASEPALARDRTSIAAVSSSTGSIAFLSSDGTEVWQSLADGSGPHRLFAAESGKSVSMITWMANKPFLIVEEARRLTEPELEDNPNKLPLPADTTLLLVRARDGVITASERGYQLIEGCAFPGDQVLLRTGDLKEPLVLSATLGPETTRRLRTASLPSVLPEKNYLWSCSVAPSTKDVALLLRTGEPGVFVGEYNAKDRTLLNAHPITSGKFSSLPHAWSTDGQSVLYEQRHDKWYLFQQQIDLHEPQPLRPPRLEGVGARLSPDGHWILFFRQDADGVYKLFRMPSDEESGVPTELAVPSGDLRCPRRGTDCIYRVQDAKTHVAGLYALDPATGAIHLWRVLPWSDSSFVDWDVSPDGAFVVLCGPTSSAGILRVFDLRHRTERLESFPVNAPFRAVNWSTNSKGWFGATYTKNGSDLYSVGVDHTVSLLRHSNYDTWAVPSPDDRFLAFLDMNEDSNVWLTQIRVN